MVVSADAESSTSHFVPISSSPNSARDRIQPDSPLPRQASTARLASPIPGAGTPQLRQLTQHTPRIDSQDDLHLSSQMYYPSLPGPGVSALAAALNNTYERQPSQHGTPPLRPSSPFPSENHLQSSAAQSNYGSFDRIRLIQGAPGWNGPATYEDPEIVKRHLVQPTETSQAEITTESIVASGDTSVGISKQNNDATSAPLLDEFSSLRLQGGDITRPIYKWTEEAEARAHGLGRQGRSRSFHLSRPQPENEILDIGSIKVPGGFRRNFLRRIAMNPSCINEPEQGTKQAQLFTNSFIEFLTIYGHFAGETLEEDDEALGSNDSVVSGAYFDEGPNDGRESTENTGLLSSGRRKRKERKPPGTNGISGAVLLLLKSFVGTGVLFLPKAYLNGGMVFSNIILLLVAVLSYYCFVLLIETRLKVEGSFGDMGGILYGNWFRNMILISIVFSQIGFVAAYIIFTSENLQAFILAVSHCQTYISIPWLILMQVAVFLPFSLLRDISKLGFTALIADAFILFGLLVLYHYDIDTIINQGGISDIVNFNSQSWSLFIGTAIFTFEGIGLIIPIQESMKSPKKFPAVLGGVMIIIILIFLSMGAISYAAYGSKTETVIILNLPQDSKLVNGVQFLYSIAILLSTPLQIFPAIRITENEIFTRSGKYNPYIKWKKNSLRFFVVMLCAAVAWVGADDLDKFVSLVGSFACIPLVYIYPPMLHIRGAAKNNISIFGDILLCIFGAIVMIYTTFLTISSWANTSLPLPKTNFCNNV
ncbi:unnamed protein product [Blumeria hordei]|uniref:Amino acid transporter transmembrane domain-containing protein n=2 Tax=Blumeria hordei TaxID=2867405 RepID=A0A383UX82_BLUHO|nr:transporter [Blumeria hordei DH14]SZF04527.1 unnamed protein product [Blumeria hordei]